MTSPTTISSAMVSLLCGFRWVAGPGLDDARRLTAATRTCALWILRSRAEILEAVDRDRGTRERVNESWVPLGTPGAAEDPSKRSSRVNTGPRGDCRAHARVERVPRREQQLIRCPTAAAGPPHHLLSSAPRVRQPPRRNRTVCIPSRESKGVQRRTASDSCRGPQRWTRPRTTV